MTHTEGFSAQAVPPTHVERHTTRTSQASMHCIHLRQTSLKAFVHMAGVMHMCCLAPTHQVNVGIHVLLKAHGHEAGGRRRHTPIAGHHLHPRKAVCQPASHPAEPISDATLAGAWMAGGILGVSVMSLACLVCEQGQRWDAVLNCRLCFRNRPATWLQPSLHQHPNPHKVPAVQHVEGSHAPTCDEGSMVAAVDNAAAGAEHGAPSASLLSLTMAP